MDLEDFMRITSRDDAGVVEFCREHGLLRKCFHCGSCSRDYSTIKWKSDTCGYVFRCPGCRSKKKLTADTFFDGSKLPIRKLLGLIYMWSYSVAVNTTTAFLGVSSATVVQWYQYCRDICSWQLLEEPLRLGGPEKIVQIDESLLVRAKYNRGRQLRAQQRWVFGIYDPSTKEGYIELVPDRSAETLLPIIQRIVVPGTEIWSDEWAAYRPLGSLGYRHATVNHSKHFKDPATGTCTNHVEAYWNAVKRTFKKMFGTTAEMVPSYLDEHMWRERHGRTGHMAFLSIIRHIARRYRVD